MANTIFDVVGVGNAIVDVLAETGDDFLTAQAVVKGAMTLIGPDRAEALYAAMPPAVEAYGGSAANTIAGLAALGARCGFIGRVKNDQLGQVFAHDIKSLGVHFETPMANDGTSTARCLVLVTKDAQRSMSTYLGASVELSPEDVDPKLVAAAKIVYLEGYLWDPPLAKSAMRRAIDLSRKSGGKIALSLSDAFCVDRYRSEFLDLIADGIDILFANQSEIFSLYQTDSLDDAVAKTRATGVLTALTRSEQGALIIRNEETHSIPPEPPLALVDSTGAGDQFAAGFLYGYTRERDLRTCGLMGAIAASEVLDHIGPRPLRSVAELFRKKSLIQ